MPTPTQTSHIFPTSGATTGSGVAWTNPADAVSENATSATSALTKSATTSQTLRVTGFNFSSIPANAAIVGVEVRIKRSTAGATVTDNSVRLSLSGASIGSNLASATNYPTTLTWATYGGSAEMWGTTLTDAQVKDSTFGVDISAKLSGTTSRTVSVDAVTVSIAYLPPGIYFEATTPPDTAAISVTVPVSVSMAATTPPDTAEIVATVPTLTISHAGTGAVAVAQNSSGSGAILTVPLPADWAVDDIFLMQVTVDSSSPPSLISGWTRFVTLSTTALYWRRAEAGDADPTFTCSPGYMNFARASISAWRNASTADSPIDSLVTGSATQPNGGYGSCPSVVVGSPGSVIFSIATYSTGTISFTRPFTNIHQISQSFSAGTTAAKAADSTGEASGGSFTGWAGGSHPVASFVLMPAPDLSPPPAEITFAATTPADTAAFSLTSAGSGVNKGFVKNAGTWVEPTYAFAKQGGVWHYANEYLKDGGTWKLMRAAPLPLDITNNASLTVEADVAFSRSFGVSNAIGTASMSIAVLPSDPGLSWNSGTFTVSGSVSAPGDYSIRLTASDSAGRSVVEWFYLTVQSSGPPEI